jgi:hypothetical protein
MLENYTIMFIPIHNLTLTSFGYYTEYVLQVHHYMNIIGTYSLITS